MRLARCLNEMKLKRYLKEQKEKKIFLDMDGVIVNFVEAVNKLFNISDFKDWEAMGDDRYTDINKIGEKWWSQMNWLNDGKKLWNYIKDYDVTILSATPLDPKSKVISKEGKKNWLSKNMGSSYSGNALIVDAVDKQKYADENHILIDDSPRNIKQWKRKGGIGVLHKNANDTIKQLKEII